MKKNFFKKLSFVLALAMIISVLAPASGAFAAAKAPKLNSTKKYLHLDVDKKNEYNFNISNKGKGWKYEWTSANEDVAEVNAKNGVTTATGVGTTTVSVNILDKDGEEVDTLKAKVIVRDNIAELGVYIQKDDTAFDKLAVGKLYDFGRTFTTVSGSTTKTSAITRWEVSEGTIEADSGKFTPEKAGEYTITARAFQSKEKYNLWLDDAEANKGYVLAEKSVTVKAAASMVEVNQLDPDSFKVTFNSPVADADGKLSVHSLIGTTKVNELIKKVTMNADNTEATVDLFVPFKAETTYYVEYPEMEAGQFVAAARKAENVASMKIATTKVPVYESTELNIQLLNKDGVVIADKDDDPESLLARITTEQTNLAPVLDGRMLTMFKVGDSTTVTATYHSYDYDPTTGEELGNLKAAGTIVCVDQTTDNRGNLYAYTIEANNTANPDFKDVKHSLAAGDYEISNLRLFVQLKGVDADDEDLYTDNGVGDAQAPLFTFTSSNEDILIVNEVSGDLYPVKPGTAVVVVKYDDKIVGAATITVSTSRKLANVVLTDYQFSLSNDLQVQDTKTVEVKSVKDQLGEDYSYYVFTLKLNGRTTDYGLSTQDATGATEYAAGTDLIFNGAAITDPDNLGTYSYTVKFIDTRDRDITMSKAITVTVAEPTDKSDGSNYYVLLESNKDAYDLKVASDDTTETLTLALFGYGTNGVRTERLDLSDAGAYNVTVTAPSNGTVPTGLTTTVTRDALNKTATLELVAPVTGGAIVGSNGIYAKMPTGTYTVKVTEVGTGNAVAQTYFTVTDSQTKPVLSFLKGFSDEVTLVEAVKDCLKITIDGDDALLALTDADIVKTGVNNDTVFVKSINVYKEIANGNKVKFKVDVDRTIKFNQ